MRPRAESRTSGDRRRTWRRRLLAGGAPAVVLLFPVAGAEAAPQVTLGGYLKNFSVAYTLRETQRNLWHIEPAVLGSVTDRLRLDARSRLTPRLSVALSYSLAGRVQDRALFEGALTPAVDPLVYRFADLDARLYPGSGEPVSSFGLYQNLDRAQLVWSAPRFDLIAGRQAIAWGAARAVNPTDVIAPFVYSELDTEDRIGVDAVRLRIPVGLMNEVDLGWVPGEDFKAERSAFFLRAHLNDPPNDWSLVAVGFRENLLVGFDVTGPAGGWGWWLEAAYVFVDTFADSAAAAGEDYLRLSVGADHRLGANGYGYIEYHFNGPGAARAEETGSLARVPYTEGAVYLTGKHYLAPGFTWQATPLWSLGLSALVNVRDPSALVSPVAEYNIAENVYLSAGAFIGVGAGIEQEFIADLPVPFFTFRSEFGAYPGLYYFSFRTYF